jgi:hypothetical protein
MADKCWNCGQEIGTSQTPHVFEGHVVCATCDGQLRPAMGEPRCPCCRGPMKPAKATWGPLPNTVGAILTLIGIPTLLAGFAAWGFLPSDAGVAAFIEGGAMIYGGAIMLAVGLYCWCCYRSVLKCQTCGASVAAD